MRYQLCLSLISLSLPWTALCLGENGRSPDIRAGQATSDWKPQVDVMSIERIQQRQAPTNASPNFPNPCYSKDFVRPVYELSNVTMSVTQPGGQILSVRELDFILRDTANNYTMNCTWGPIDSVYEIFWYSSKCYPENNPDIDAFKYRFLLKMQSEWDPRKNLSISQVWVCDQKDGSYPLLYEAAVNVTIIADCPRGNLTDDIHYPCNITTQFPLSVGTVWSPPIYFDNLERRPSPPLKVTPAPAPYPSKDCTDMSLTYPDWIIENFYFQPSGIKDSLRPENVNFTVTSRATGVKALCLPGKQTLYDDALWEVNCSTTAIAQQPQDDYRSQTTFPQAWYDLRQHSVYIKQQWLCGDSGGNHSTSFVAYGSQVMPIYCTADGGNTCRASKTTIRGRLDAPTYLFPAAVPNPPNTKYPGCTGASSSPMWTVENLLYYRTRFGNIPDYVSAIARHLEIRITNIANNFTQSCLLTDPELDGPNEKWFQCFPEPQHTYPEYSIETYIQFNEETLRLAVNQTWYCDDTEDGPPVSFTAIGGTTLYPWICGYTNITQGSWQCGTFAPFTCTPHYDIRWCNSTLASFYSTIWGTVEQQRELPDNALTAPNPTGYSCTVQSLAWPTVWRLQDISLITRFVDQWSPHSTITNLQLSLNSSTWAGQPGGGLVKLSGGGVAEMTPYFPGSNPSTVYTNYQRDFPNFLQWQLRYDPVPGYMELNVSWYCEDKNPDMPIVFNATWNGYVPLNCSFVGPPKDQQYQRDPRYATDIVCDHLGGDPVITPTVTWYTNERPIPDETR